MCTVIEFRHMQDDLRSYVYYMSQKLLQKQ